MLFNDYITAKPSPGGHQTVTDRPSGLDYTGRYAFDGITLERSEIVLEVRERFKDLDSKTRFFLVKVLPAGETEYLSSLFEDDSPLVFRFDVRNEGERDFYQLEFFKSPGGKVETAEITLSGSSNSGKKPPRLPF